MAVAPKSGEGPVVETLGECMCVLSGRIEATEQQDRTDERNAGKSSKHLLRSHPVVN